jgi:hypothetical protein
MFVCGGFAFGVRTTYAATMYLSPASGTYAVGKTFTVNVVVSTPDQAANAYSGTVTYPKDKLEMTAIGKGGSIVSLWVQEPSFTSERASFEGVTFNPGYKGGAGRVVSFTFRAKAPGTAAVRFSSGAVLANDGSGTSILKGTGGATYTLTAPTEKPPTPPPVEVVEVPGIHPITSNTHPDPEKWYAFNRATFLWNLQKGVTGVSFSVDQNPTSDPGTASAGALSSTTVENIEDGVWYFHLRARNQTGWGAVSHFKFQIDTKKPDPFIINEVITDVRERTTKSFTINALDSGSGIDHYEVALDNGAAETWVDDGTHIYRIRVPGSGVHTLYAKVFDKAGNIAEASVQFTVEGLAIPIITEYPQSPIVGDELVVKGTAIPNHKVTVWVQKGQETPLSRDVTSDLQGRFAFVADDTLELATYQVWATVSDAFGNISEPSEKETIVVKEPPFDFWAWFTGILILYRCLIVISFLLLILLILLWRYFMLKRRLTRKVDDAQDALHKVFDLLKQDIQEQVKTLEQAKTERELTIEENRVLEKLKFDLKSAEDYLYKRIEEIKNRK